MTGPADIQSPSPTPPVAVRDLARNPNAHIYAPGMVQKSGWRSDRVRSNRRYTADLALAHRLKRQPRHARVFINEGIADRMWQEAGETSYDNLEEMYRGETGSLDRTVTELCNAEEGTDGLDGVSIWPVEGDCGEGWIAVHAGSSQGMGGKLEARPGVLLYVDSLYDYPATRAGIGQFVNEVMAAVWGHS